MYVYMDATANRRDEDTAPTASAPQCRKGVKYWRLYVRCADSMRLHAATSTQSKDILVA